MKRTAISGAAAFAGQARRSRLPHHRTAGARRLGACREDTPEWAYGAIIYTGPDAGEYTPSIVALVSKLTGNVDPQQIIDVAPGELNNLPGWSAMNEGEVSSLGEYPPTNSAAPRRRTARPRSSRRRRS